MAAPEILDLLVMVRIHVGQPFEKTCAGAHFFSAMSKATPELSNRFWSEVMKVRTAYILVAPLTGGLFPILKNQPAL
jgi:hypothetical protein